MEDAEFCRRYARVLIDSNLSKLHILCEAFVRAPGILCTADDLAAELTHAVRKCDNSMEAYQVVHDLLLGKSAPPSQDYLS